MEPQFVCFGTACSPAAALRELKLRPFALPFDWVEVYPSQVCEIIRRDFEGYHDNLRALPTKVTDGYGVFFPHDYPTVEQPVLHVDEDAAAGGIYEKRLQPGWEVHIPVMREKYSRRIERFQTMFRSKQPIVALFRGSVKDVPMILNTLTSHYKKQNIVFVVATTEPSSHPYIVTCEPERCGTWNDPNVWKEGIDRARALVAELPV